MERLINPSVIHTFNCSYTIERLASFLRLKGLHKGALLSVSMACFTPIATHGFFWKELACNYNTSSDWDWYAVRQANSSTLCHNLCIPYTQHAIIDNGASNRATVPGIRREIQVPVTTSGAISTSRKKSLPSTMACQQPCNAKEVWRPYPSAHLTSFGMIGYIANWNLILIGGF